MPEGDLRGRVVELGPLAHANPPTSGNAFSRWVLERLLPMPVEEFRICADAYLVMLASTFGPVRRNLVPLSSWRRHGENRYNGIRETVAERVAADLERYDVLAAILAVYLESQGTRVDPAIWRRRNTGYRRLERIRSSLAAIERFVPHGGGVVLVDDGDWRQGHLENRELLQDRQTFRLFDGATLAEPPAEQAVLVETRRLRRAGATHIVFAWPGAWWLQQYPALESYLRTQGGPIPGDVLAFELPKPGRRTPPDAWQCARTCASIRVLDGAEARSSTAGRQDRWPPRVDRRVGARARGVRTRERRRPSSRRPRRDSGRRGAVMLSEIQLPPNASERVARAVEALDIALHEAPAINLEWLDESFADDGWALAPDALRLLAALVAELRPRHVVEFGSGVSTLVLARAAASSDGSAISSVDHDPVYVARTATLLQGQEGEELVSLQLAPLVARVRADELHPHYLLDRGAARVRAARGTSC